MNEYALAIASAFWLGVLTSISPCPLATNIAAMSFVGRRVGNARRVFLAGTLYTGGRALTYGLLGVALVGSLLSAPALSISLPPSCRGKKPNTETPVVSAMAHQTIDLHHFIWTERGLQEKLKSYTIPISS